MKPLCLHTLLKLAILLFLVFAQLSAQSTQSDSSMIIVSPKPGLIPVPLPKLDRLEEPVANQIRSLQQAFIELVDKGNLTDADLVEGYATLGQLYHAYEFMESAESCYLNARHLAPENYTSLHLLAVLYQQWGRLTESVIYYKLMREKRPDYVAAASNLATVYLKQNRLDEARKEFQSALQLDPDFAAALEGMGQVALAERKYSEAIKYFNDALARVPAANRIHYSLAMAYRGMGDVEKAKLHLSQRGTVGIRPVDPLVDGLKDLLLGERVYLIRGRMAMAAGRFKEATVAFTKAIDANAGSVPARVNMGVSLAQLGDVDGAIKQFRLALRYDPRNQNALFNLGTQLLLKKKYAEAIEQFQSILEINPNDLVATRELAEALAQSGREDQALNHLFRLSAFAPEDELTLIALAELLAKQEQFKEAINVLDQGNTRFPDRGLTAHNLARLLASCPDTTLRDGMRAVDLATRVFEAQNTPTHAETLAKALAEVGRCEEAAALQKQLVDMAKQFNSDELASRFKLDLVRYEKGSPCRPAWQEVK